MSAIAVDQIFSSFKNLFIALKDWSISAKFTNQITKADTKCVIVDCAIPTCIFHLWAYIHEDEYVIVGTLADIYTCLGSALTSCRTSSRQSWLQYILPTIISITKDTKLQAIIEAVQLRFQEKIQYNAAFLAKTALLADNTNC